MRGFRLNGWQRIGIVLSVLWAIGAWFHYRSAALDAAQSVMDLRYETCTDAKGPQNDFDFKPCMDEASKAYQREYGDRAAIPWIAAFLPIPFAWLFAYIVVWIVRWIRRGFSPSSS